VKVGDPDLLSVNLAGPVKSLVQYYPPEFLNFHRQSVSGCVFSLGMCIMEIVFLEALTDCYDYQEHSFNEQAFHARINRLKAIPELSDNFVQVLLKMLSISEKQRPSMQELEQHLVQVVDAPGSSSSQCQSETKQNKPQSEMVAA
jgi:serine/threonine protein kinase